MFISSNDSLMIDTHAVTKCCGEFDPCESYTCGVGVLVELEQHSSRCFNIDYPAVKSAFEDRVNEAVLKTTGGVKQTGGVQPVD